MAKKLLKTIFFNFKLATSNDDQQLDEDDINELKCVEEDDEDKSSCSWSQQPNSSSVTNLLLSPIGVPNICFKINVLYVLRLPCIMICLTFLFPYVTCMWDNFSWVLILNKLCSVPFCFKEILNVQNSKFHKTPVFPTVFLGRTEIMSGPKKSGGN